MSEYIDRAALKRELAPYEENDFSQQMDVILAIVDEQPAADVVEVRHARWIKHEGYDECEACHAKAIYGSNYCPSCGALMDKEADHDKDLL